MVERLWLMYILHNFIQYSLSEVFICVSFVCLFVRFLDLRAPRSQLTFFRNLIFPLPLQFFLALRGTDFPGSIPELQHSTKTLARTIPSYLASPFLYPSVMPAFLRFSLSLHLSCYPSTHLIVTHYFENCLLVNNSQNYILKF